MFHKMLHGGSLFSVIALVFLGCGGGGGGGSAGTQPTTPTNPSNPEPSKTTTFQGLKEEGGELAGTARVDSNGKYIYTYKGIDVDVTYPGITAGTVIDMTVGDKTMQIGGSTYSYSRFGAISQKDDLTQMEVFYVGKQTASMPTTGTAAYNGLLITGDRSDISTNGVYPVIGFDNVPVHFDVNYGEKSITGYSLDDGDPYIKFNEGKITGATFAGKVEHPDPTRFKGVDFSGSFFGPNAEELGGTVSFIDVENKKQRAASFGAKK